MTLTHRYRSTITGLLGLCVLLAACSTTSQRLSDSDRRALRHQPVIHVVHYDSPLPVVKTIGKATTPRAEQLRQTSGMDPAALVATGFGRLLEKTERLRNVQIESTGLPRPVRAHPRDLHARFAEGLTLELWVEQWGVEAIPGLPHQYSLRLDGSARLSDPGNGRVLWASSSCRVSGMTNRAYRSSAGDLSNPAKLHKLLVGARNECARQLARDLDNPSSRRSS